MIGAIGMVLGTGLSFAEDVKKPDPAMEKLKGLVGDWMYEGEQIDTKLVGLPFGPAGKYSGTATTRYVLGGFFQENKWQDKEGPANNISGTVMRGYDTKDKCYVINLYLSNGGKTVTTATLNGRVWTANSSMTTEAGKKVLTKWVTKYSSDWNSYVTTSEASSDNGKTWKFFCKEKGKKVGADGIASSTTRKDFEEFCKLHEGHWVGEIVLTEDSTGLGKKGDKVIIHRQCTISANGSALVCKSFNPKSSGQSLITYDASSQKIKGMYTSSTGSMMDVVVSREGGKWAFDVVGSEDDGTKLVFGLTLQFRKDKLIIEETEQCETFKAYISA